MSKTSLITEDYTETVNRVIEHLHEKHSDHLILFQARQDGPSHRQKPYYWDSVSYAYLKENEFECLPIDGEKVVMAASSFCHDTKKSVIIIDNTVIAAPMYMVIHPPKEPTNG